VNPFAQWMGGATARSATVGNAQAKAAPKKTTEPKQTEEMEIVT